MQQKKKGHSLNMRFSKYNNVIKGYLMENMFAKKPSKTHATTLHLYKSLKHTAYGALKWFHHTYIKACKCLIL